VAADRGGMAIGMVGLPARPEVASLPVRLAPRPVFLAGREDLLAELDARLAADGQGPRIVVLSGLGGVGKTSVAVEYAHRHLADLGLAWQFTAEDPAVLKAEFGELAALLSNRDLFDARDPVAMMHGVLAAYPRGWLVVFDNVPDPASVAPFVPPAGRGRVLITSRDPFWPGGQALEVPALEPDVAAGFLVNRTGDPDGQTARELAVELGGLPLALEQAAAYVQATGGSLAGYLASFRRRRPEMLVRGEPTGYGKTVATTWSLAFERLESSAPDAAGLLRLLAFCAPEAIPLRLLLQPHPGLAGQFATEVGTVLVPLLEDELAVGDAVVALRRYSLVTPVADGSVSVHRLVQAVTADQMATELAGEWRQAAAALIEAAIPDDAQLPEAWPACAALLPHAQAALDLTSDGMRQIAQYLGNSGSYAAARDLFQVIVDAYQEDDGYRAENRDTLTARQELARWTGEAGDAAAARDQSAALLLIRERVLGPDHPDTLITRDNLAGWTGKAGDAAAARDQYAAVLPIRERVLGPDHPDTLTTRNNRAYLTGEAGDAAAARGQYAALLPVVERVLGPEHPSTLNARHNLARWTGLAGDAAAARDQAAVLLPIRERVLGPEHPETLITRDNLAHWTGEAGDAAAARDQYVAVLPIRERVLGPEHPSTLNARHNLAHWTGEAGDAAAARDLYAVLLPIRERVLGPEHPDTLTTRINLASWTGLAGDAAAARDQYAALLPVLEQVLVPDHPDTLTARQELARLTGEAGDPAAARDLFAALLPVRERVSGPEHPRTLTARHNLAAWTGRAGDPAAARDLFAALLPVRVRVLGPEHPDTLAIRAWIGNWTGEAGDPAAARDQLAALLPLLERVSGPEHPDTLTVRANLARWTGEAGDPAAARDQLAALLSVLERVSGPEHPHTLTARHELARWAGRADGGPGTA
jgi:Tetratricopeptide repeat